MGYSLPMTALKHLSKVKHEKALISHYISVYLTKNAINTAEGPRQWTKKPKGDIDDDMIVSRRIRLAYSVVPPEGS